MAALVKGWSDSCPVAMRWQGGTGISGQASDKPPGTKPRGVGRVLRGAGSLWGFE